MILIDLNASWLQRRSTEQWGRASPAHCGISRPCSSANGIIWIPPPNPSWPATHKLFHNWIELLFNRGFKGFHHLIIEKINKLRKDLLRSCKASEATQCMSTKLLSHIVASAEFLGKPGWVSVRCLGFHLYFVVCHKTEITCTQCCLEFCRKRTLQTHTD